MRQSVNEMVTRTNDPFQDKVIGYVAPRAVNRRGYHLVIREKPLKQSFIDLLDKEKSKIPSPQKYGKIIQWCGSDGNMR